MTPAEIMRAARVPPTVPPQAFGPWTIERRLARDSILGDFDLVGADDYTLLRRHTMATLHLEGGEIVMEDSVRELSKHLPIWLAARGRVLKTGLGLGCVVRGLLTNPAVEHVDVVEIDAHIVRVIGAEFAGDPRVTIHHADALEWDFGDRRWDYAWHDIWTEGNAGLQALHMKLIMRFWDAVGRNQGAWAFPRVAHRAAAFRLLGAPKTRRQRAPRMANPAEPQRS
jgi:hypothetical protein